jgi:hypothetical protein
VGIAGNAQPSRFCYAFQARGDVDAIAQKIAASDHYIANMDADPKPKCPIWGYASIQVAQCLLDLHGAFDSVDCTGKLRQHTVPSGIDDPASTLGNQPVHDGAVSRKGAEGSDLILAHEA